MSKPYKKNRREFLQKSLMALATPYALSPLDRLFGTHLLTAGVSSAYAQSQTIEPRRYFSYLQRGAPPRWMYDLFLTPYGTQNYMQNPMVTTKYVESGGRYTNTAYETVSVKGINAPYMWSFDVPLQAGGNRPMTDLLDHLLCIQGINTANAGHPGSTQGHYHPLGALQSTPAMSTDVKGGPLEAIAIGVRDFVYKSNGKSSYTSVANNGNMIEKLMAPYQNGLSGDLQNDMQLAGQLVDTLSLDLQDHFLELHKRSTASVNSRISAKSTSQFSGSSNYTTEWNNLLAKYQLLIDRAVDPTIQYAGLNDLPVGVTGTRDLRYSMNNEANIITTPDVRDLYANGVKANAIAINFAIAEYLLVNNLSYSVSVQGGSINNLTRNGNSSGGASVDEHRTGTMISVLNNFYLHRAFSTCLLELIDRLKVAGIYNDTLVEVAGEFNRSPRANRTGSDHAWQGKSVAYYSGSINGPVILGELVNSGSSTYTGSWGMGGVNSNLGKTADLMGQALTLAGLLRTPSPFVGAPGLPLATVSGGAVTSPLPLSKIVA